MQSPPEPRDHRQTRGHAREHNQASIARPVRELRMWFHSLPTPAQDQFTDRPTNHIPDPPSHRNDTEHAAKVIPDVDPSQLPQDARISRRVPAGEETPHDGEDDQHRQAVGTQTPEQKDRDRRAEGRDGDDVGDAGAVAERR